MEAVAPHSAIPHLLRQGEHAGDFGLALVKGRVETGNLRDLRHAPPHDPDRLEVMRLMQRRERHQGFEGLNDGIVDEHGAGKERAAMDNSVPDRHELALLLDSDGARR